MARMRSRLRALEDERDLRALLFDYALFADLGQRTEFGNLFTVDGVIDLGPQADPTRFNRSPAVFDGRVDIRDHFIGGPGHKSIEGRCQHHVSEQVAFAIDGDHAVATGYSFVLVADIDRLTVGMAMFRRWTFARVNRKWLIASCTVRPIGSRDVESTILTDRLGAIPGKSLD